MRIAALLMLTSSAWAMAQTPPAEEIADLMARSQYEAASDAAIAWQERAPDDAQAAYWAGRTAGQMAMGAGMFSAMSWAGDSREAFEKAVELDPGYVDAQFALMQYYLIAPGIAGGDKEEAKNIAKRLEQLSPLAGHKAKSQFLFREKDNDGYLREMEAALALAPADPEALGSIVGSYLSKDDSARAKAAIDAAVAIDPAQPLIRYQFAKWAAITGQELELALQTVDELLALPRYPDGFSLAGAHHRRGQILSKLGRKADALSAYEAALALEPKHRLAKEDLAALRKQS
jgi:tetratricopeptide (TPR) repeat protein